MLLRIHFMQQWFSLSDEAVEDALHDVQVYRAFAGIDLGATRIPDATTVVRFQRSTAHGMATGFLATINAVLEAKGLLLRRGTAVDATIARAPTNKSAERNWLDALASIVITPPGIPPLA